MELKKSQINFLNKYTIGSWTFNNKTGLVDIEGNFNCSGINIRSEKNKLKDFKGVKFGIVTGYFSCHCNSLTSLVGAPKKVGSGFDCSNNKLTSLVGAPQEVGRFFDCSRNKLTSLVGAPKKVGSGFHCQNNKLTSLVGAPQEVGRFFDCSRNKLTSLVGAPREVVGDFNFGDNPISPKTLNLVMNTMKKNKVDYLGALCILNTKIPKGYWNKMIRGYEDRITSEAIKTYSIVSRYSL